MQNTICLTGRLTRDPEQKNVSGKSLVTACIAVNKEFKKQGQDDADFFDLAVWGEWERNYMTNYAHKGRLIAVMGRMESRKYVDANGSNQKAWTVNVLKVSMLDRPKEDTGQEHAGNSGRSVDRQTADQEFNDNDTFDPFQN